MKKQIITIEKLSNGFLIKVETPNALQNAGQELVTEGVELLIGGLTSESEIHPIQGIKEKLTGIVDKVKKGNISIYAEDKLKVLAILEKMEEFFEV